MPLSRAEMEQVIKEGGSVLYGGQIITQIGQLPTESQLAKGDPEKEKAAAADLRSEIARLQAQIDSLTASQQEQPSGQQQGQQEGQDSSMVQVLDPLPDDFPFVTELRAASLMTYSAVRAASDEYLDSLPGIGPASIERIRAALEA